MREIKINEDKACLEILRYIKNEFLRYFERKTQHEKIYNLKDFKYILQNKNIQLDYNKLKHRINILVREGYINQAHKRKAKQERPRGYRISRQYATTIITLKIGLKKDMDKGILFLKEMPKNKKQKLKILSKKRKEIRQLTTSYLEEPKREIGNKLIRAIHELRIQWVVLTMYGLKIPEDKLIDLRTTPNPNIFLQSLPQAPPPP